MGKSSKMSLSPVDDYRKKKKRKRREEEQQEEEKKEEEESFLDTSNISSILSPRKKKKKKKKKEEEEEEEERVNGEEKKEQESFLDTSNVSSSSTASPKKKKKKKKKKKEESEERVNGEKEEQEEERKKKRKKSTKEELKEESENEEEIEEMDLIDWPKEVTNEIMKRVCDQIGVKDANRSARVTLKGIDWSVVACDGKTTESCKKHFMIIYKKINPFKNLSAVIGEMNQLVSRGDHSKPLMAIHRFMKDYFTEERKAEIKRRGESVLKKGHEAWKNLPPEEKEVYFKKFKEDRTRWSQRLAQEGDPSSNDKPTEENSSKTPKAPHQLCYEAEGRGRTHLTSRQFFASLPPHKQLPYIRQSLTAAMAHDADLPNDADHEGTAESNQRPAAANSKQHNNIVGKGELKTYLDLKGCPPFPPFRPALLFYAERTQDGTLDNVPGPNKLMEAAKIYKNLTPKEKKDYKCKLDELVSKFVDDLTSWSEKQDEVTLYALKKYKAFLPNLGVAKSSPPKSKSSKVEMAFPFTQAAVVSCPKFLSEPPRPPPNAYKLFAAKYKRTYTHTQGQDLNRAIKESWARFSDAERDKYKHRCHKLHEQYETEIRTFVSDLDTKTRKLFLGFSRVPLYKFFKNRDVFESDFPNSEEYPIFVKTKAKVDASSSPVKEGQEEEEEEEEEELTLPKKRKLSPVVFSSLEEPPHSDREVVKKKSKPSTSKTTTTAASSVASKKLKQPPQQESETDTDSDEETTTAPKTTTTTTTTSAAGGGGAGGGSTSSESEEEVLPVWKSPVALSHKNNKKKPTTTPTSATTASVASKKLKQPPQESETDTDSDEETTTAPKTTTTTTTTSAAGAGGGGGSTSSESEEEVLPVWKSPVALSHRNKDKSAKSPKKKKETHTSTSLQRKKKEEKKKKQTSSSSSGSDSD